MSREFYVYIYRNPLKNNEPFYVGKGKDDRAIQHLKKSRKTENIYKYNTIQKIIKETGNIPIIEIYLDKLNEKDAFEIEKNLIKFYGRKNNKTGILCNLTDGGEGTSGYKFLKQYIQCKDKNNIATRVTKDDPKWLSGELIGITKNIPRTEEAKEKSASKLRGRKQNIEAVEKRRIAMKGKKFTQEHCNNLSKVRKGLIFVKDKEGHCFKTTPDNPLYISGDLVGVSKNRIWCYNPSTGEQKCCDVIPEGFLPGRIRF